MNIEINTSVAVVVNKGWANLFGVRAFLREGREIQESHDESHIILARVLDSKDPSGLWITNSGQQEADPKVSVRGIMVPWSAILTIVIRQDLSPELWAEARKFGFVSEMDK